MPMLKKQEAGLSEQFTKSCPPERVIERKIVELVTRCEDKNICNAGLYSI